VLVWLLPFALVIGPRKLIALTLQHAHGHFADFGGTAFVETSPLRRLRDFGLGLYQASLGRFGFILIAPAMVGLWLAGRRDRRARPLLIRLGLFVLAYGAFTLVALPTSGHGRHLLPLAVALLTLLSLGLAECLRQPLASLGLLIVVAAVAIDSGRSVFAFRGTLPPGAALSAFVSRTLPEDRLYGARASRYLDLSFGSGSARPAIFLGEVLASLTRVSNLPSEVLVTSEVIAAPSSQARLRPLGRFCYAAAVPQVLRFDRVPYSHGASRAADCVDLLAYRVRP
jgi:hypothetical protein